MGRAVSPQVGGWMRALFAATVLAQVGALALAAPAPGQTPRAPREFGIDDESIAIVGSSSFGGTDGSIETFGSLRWSTGDATLRAPLDFLPNGARITRITYYFHDTSPAWDLVFGFCWSRLDAHTGAGFDTECLSGADSEGIDGDSYIVDEDGHDIEYRVDAGGGTTEIRQYFLVALTPALDIPTSIRAVEIRWKRRVSPAPPIATFGDVPTNHPFFQFIEALSDAGITAGCGGGNYCPDQPLTRGQMAVFLAKALGLHWPWNAP